MIKRQLRGFYDVRVFVFTTSAVLIGQISMGGGKRLFQRHEDTSEQKVQTTIGSDRRFTSL